MTRNLAHQLGGVVDVSKSLASVEIGDTKGHAFIVLPTISESDSKRELAMDVQDPGGCFIPCEFSGTQEPRVDEGVATV